MNATLTVMQQAIGEEPVNSPSPFGRWLKGIFRKVEEGEIVTDFTVRRELTNPVGLLHGGAISAIMDEMIGAVIYTLGSENFYISLNLNVDFLAPAKEGDTVTASAHLIKQGKTIINAECILQDSRGKLVARGISNLMRTDISIA